MNSVSLQYLFFPNRFQVIGTADRLTNERGRDMGSHQALECICLVEAWIQPHVEVRRPEHQRNTFRVDMAESRVRRERNHGEGINQVISELPALPESGEGRGFTLGVNVVHLLAPPFTKRLPFVEGAHGDNAASIGESLLPKRARRQPIGSGIEGVELRVRPVSSTFRLPLDEQGPDTGDQLASAAIIQDKFGSATRWYVELWPRPQRHSQLVHQFPDHRAVSHIESATHSGSPFGADGSIAEGFLSGGHSNA